MRYFLKVLYHLVIIGIPEVARIAWRKFRTNRIYARISDYIISDAGDVEKFLAFETTLWGLWLFLPMETYSTSPTFQMLARIMPENLFGAWGIAIGIAIVIARYRCGLMKYVAAIATFFWGTVWTLFALSNPASSATAIYLLPLAMSIITFVRQD